MADPIISFQPGYPIIGGPLVNSTAGSVIFAGTNGVFQQNNANLFWDDTNNYLGIGTASPLAGFQIGPTPTSTGGTANDLIFGGRVLQTDRTGVNFVANRWQYTNVSPTGAVNGLWWLQYDLASTSSAGISRALVVLMSGTPTATSGTLSPSGGFISVNPNVPAGVNATISGMSFQVAPAQDSNTNGVNGIQTIFGLDMNALGASTSSSPLAATKIAGVRVQINNRATVSTLVAAYDAVQATGSTTGAVTDFAVINNSSAILNSSNVVNWSFLRFDQTPTGPTGNKLAFNITSTLPSIHAGKFAIGSTTAPTDALEVTGAARVTTALRVGSAATPTHFVEVAAGTTSKAPILLTAGTNLTTATAGAIEFDGSDWFLTV